MRQINQLLHGRLHGLRAPLERGVFKEVEEVEQDFVQGGGEGLDLGGVEQALVVGGLRQLHAYEITAAESGLHLLPVSVFDVFDNINLNARFQWRYQPASDLFIVYTENYLPADLFSKNRALVFKMTYWLNL